MKVLYKNDKDDLQPNSRNTKIKSVRCDACTHKTREILSGEYKNESHEGHRLITIQRNEMENCRCLHRFDLLICGCMKCEDRSYFSSTEEAISKLLDYIDHDELRKGLD